MKAIRTHTYKGGPLALVYEDAPRPQPDQGEVLVRVYAIAVTPTELTWDASYQTKSGADRLPSIPGHELAGVVEEVGSGVTGLTASTAVYGLTDFWRDGAEAEYAIALPSELATKPPSLSFEEASAIPMAGLTAWQALFEHAKLSAGQTVLIHGAAGGVGSIAVQLARWAGAHVIATASASKRDFLTGLGVEQIIDYTATRFEEAVNGVDVVLDTVGGDTLKRSFGVLKKGGTLISIAQPVPAEQSQAHDVRGIFFIVEPNGKQLGEISRLVEDGVVKPIVEEIVPLSQAREAYERGLARHNRGKVILQVRT
jgi:NADPH:quinone reductase-like Zn-dependent oxidoreductase